MVPEIVRLFEDLGLVARTDGVLARAMQKDKTATRRATRSDPDRQPFARKEPPMSHQPQTDLAFVETFVDALTVRPFLNDLRRTRRSRLLLQALALDGQDDAREADTATAA
jgi:hypothetical protein